MESYSILFSSSARFSSFWIRLITTHSSQIFAWSSFFFSVAIFANDFNLSFADRLFEIENVIDRLFTWRFWSWKDSRKSSSIRNPYSARHVLNEDYFIFRFPRSIRFFSTLCFFSFSEYLWLGYIRDNHLSRSSRVIFFPMYLWPLRSTLSSSRLLHLSDDDEIESVTLIDLFVKSSADRYDSRTVFFSDVVTMCWEHVVIRSSTKTFSSIELRGKSFLSRRDLRESRYSKCFSEYQTDLVSFLDI